jgi:hypothetical protein
MVPQKPAPSYDSQTKREGRAGIKPLRAVLTILKGLRRDVVQDALQARAIFAV